MLGARAPRAPRIPDLCPGALLAAPAPEVASRAPELVAISTQARRLRRRSPSDLASSILLTMPTYYVTTIAVRTATPTACVAHGVSMLPRAWGVGITDWAYLATSSHHEIRVEYQLADVLAHGCNMEFAMEADDIDDARQRFRAFYAMLLLNGVPPFFAPFICSHSINDFSNVSAPPLPPSDPRAARVTALRTGVERVEMQWNEPHLGSLHTPVGARSAVRKDDFRRAAKDAAAWSTLSIADAPTLMLQETLISAPQIRSHGQSIMQMWSGLESLFPKVNAELSFRLALYLAQFVRSSGDRRPYFERIRSAYKVRSDIAHGSNRRANLRTEQEEWTDAWGILTDVARATMARGGVPTEATLTAELLGGPSSA